jgi:hypothetical protein
MYDFRNAEYLIQFCAAYCIPDVIVYKSGLFLDHSGLSKCLRNKIVKSYLLGYSINTLKRHRNIKTFFNTLKVRSIADIIPKMNLFLIESCENGKTYDSLSTTIDSLRFIVNFLDLHDIKEKTFYHLRRYVKKFAVKRNRKRLGLQKSHLDVIFKSIDCISSLSLCMYRSFIMIVFMYYTLCRYNCVTNIQMKHITFHDNFLEIVVPKSKTDQEGHGQTVYVPHKSTWSPHRLLCNYIHVFNLDETDENFLFPPLNWKPRMKQWVPDGSKPLSYKAAYSALKRFLKSCNVDSTYISLHSMRIGGTTDCLLNKVPDHVIDAKARWRNPGTKRIYDRRDLTKEILKYA